MWCRTSYTSLLLGLLMMLLISAVSCGMPLSAAGRLATPRTDAYTPNENTAGFHTTPGTLASAALAQQLGTRVTTHLPRLHAVVFHIPADQSVHTHADTLNSVYSIKASAILLNVPAAPTQLVALPSNMSKITLTWIDNASNESGYKIERKTGVDGIWAEVGVVAANVKTYADLGLAAATKYYYRVQATSDAGDSTYSNEANATTFALPAPSNLAATAINTSQIDLNWTDTASDETGFRIERKIGSSGTWSQIAIEGANITSHSDTGLTVNNTYYYRIRAYNSTGYSPYSAVVNATTSEVNAPTNLRALPSNMTKITLTWTDNASGEMGYRIECKNGSEAFTEIATVGANITSYADSSLTAATIYTYRVRAYDVVSTSAYSNESSAKTFALPQPGNFTASAISTSQIDLSWIDTATDETGFKIERKIGSSGTWSQIATVGANVTAYSNTGLTASTTYYYRVRSYNSMGYSTYSAAVPVTTYLLLTTPSSPAAVAINMTSIRITWSDTNIAEDGYRIERKTGAGGTWAEIGTVAANTISYTSTGLSAATQYYYRVRAYCAGGYSDYSAEVSATTYALPMPTGLAATVVSSSKINLAWNDTSTGEIGFKIERRIGIGTGTWSQIATVGANSTSYQNTGLTAATSYSYRVRAYNDIGASIYSNIATATTLVRGPGILNQAGATYILAQDISASGTAFTVLASGITLDLNGHTITYNTTASSSSVYGIQVGTTDQPLAMDNSGFKLKNGTITQGNGSSSYSHAMDFTNSNANNVEISGITSNVRGDSCEAIYVSEGQDINVHHNYFNSSIASIGTRYNYDGFAARFSFITRLTFTDNTISGGHGGVASANCTGIAIQGNDISHRCLGGNGYGILTWDAQDGIISNNYIHTTDGLGILIDNNTQNLEVAFNTIDVQMAPKDEGINAWGIKCRTWNTTADPYGLKVHDNVIISVTGDGLQVNAAGLGIYSAKVGMNSEYYNNTIIAVTTSASHGAFGFKIAGDEASDTGTKVYNNTVTSNNINICVSSEDGHGANGVLLANNTFIKGANPVDYHTIRIGYWRWASHDHVFLGNKVQGGASMSDVQLIGSDPPGDYNYSYYLKWNVDITVKDQAGLLLSGIGITAVGANGVEQVYGITDAQGHVVLPLTHYFCGGTTYPATSDYTIFNPYVLSISDPNYAEYSQEMVVSDNQSLLITLSPKVLP